LTAAIQSPAAERMRRHRQRRKEGLRCAIIDIREAEIDELVRRGLLSTNDRNDPYAIVEALYRFLDAALVNGRPRASSVTRNTA
jgi:hypothetical protein